MFLDTNILVYALSSDLKRHHAQELLAAGGTVSIQVLNELVHVLRRTLERDWADIEAALEDLGALLEPPVQLTFAIHQSARWLARDHGFAFYDARSLPQRWKPSAIFCSPRTCSMDDGSRG